MSAISAILRAMITGLLIMLGGSVLASCTLIAPDLTEDGARPGSPVITADATPDRGPGDDVDPESGLPWVDLDQLPPEATETADLIAAGGPFPYGKDGSTFGNREGILPDEPRGYYREYTVPTPGSRDRGARRIVAGDDDRILYYTDDHYESFARIRS